MTDQTLDPHDRSLEEDGLDSEAPPIEVKGLYSASATR